jgi:hypothetical protein
MVRHACPLLSQAIHAVFRWTIVHRNGRGGPRPIYYPSGFISTTGSCPKDTRAGTYVNLPLHRQMLFARTSRLRYLDSDCSWSMPVDPRRGPPWRNGRDAERHRADSGPKKPTCTARNLAALSLQAVTSMQHIRHDLRLYCAERPEEIPTPTRSFGRAPLPSARIRRESLAPVGHCWSDDSRGARPALQRLPHRYQAIGRSESFHHHKSRTAPSSQLA